MTDEADYWLLDVSDAAVDRPPTPAIDRDAADGGLGLYLIAQMCSAHGWTVDEERKHVWACVDHPRADGTARDLRRRARYVAAVAVRPSGAARHGQYGPGHGAAVAG